MEENCSVTEDDVKKLTDLFDDAFEIYERLQNTVESSSSVKLQMEIKKCIHLLEKSTHLINVAGVFSSNETLDEIPTHNIKYLLIPALLGNLVLKVNTPERLNALETAEVYFKDFIKRIEEYEIVSHVELGDDENEEEEEEAKPRKLDLLQLAVQRNEKIKRYKEQKEVEAELKRLKSLMRKDDEEICRTYYLTYIKNLVKTSMDELRMIGQEKPLAKHLRDNRGKKTFVQQQAKENKVQMKPFRPIIITKNELQKKVFGAGYPSLPTMTVDEFYKERVAEGIFPAHGTSHGKVLQEMTDPEVVKREEEKEAIEKENEIETDDPKYLEKARNMDEYKDDHRRGWGNRMNRS